MTTETAGMDRVVALLALCALATPVSAAGPARYNWGLDRNALTSSAEFAQSKAICRRAGAPRPPAADQPTAGQRRLLRDCDAEALYYGFTGRQDVERARLCAFIEVETVAEGPNQLSGPAILMQIYANGRGVRRDLNLATAFACQIDGAPAENDARVKHLQTLRRTGGEIDFCDDITSGMAGGVCASRNASVAAKSRNARLATLINRLSPEARRLYAPMKAAFDAYVDADGAVVENGGGTAAFAMEVNEQEAVRDAFVRDLARLLGGRWPVASAADARIADSKLNDSYQQAMAEAKDALAYQPSSVEDLRKAERTWVAYRDAYLRFAAAASPGVRGDAILAHLTRQRTAEIGGLAAVG